MPWAVMMSDSRLIFFSGDVMGRTAATPFLAPNVRELGWSMLKMRKEDEKGMNVGMSGSEENRDEGLHSVREEIKAFFTRFKKNKTIVINLGSMDKAEEFIERLNVIIQVANSFKFDLVGMESDRKESNGMVLGIFKNVDHGLAGIRIHLEEHGEEDDAELVSMEEHEGIESEEEEDQEQEDDAFLPIPIRRKKRKKPLLIPLYV